MVYSVFNNKSNQSSLRRVTYEGENWNVINHFFFMSHKDIEDLALGTHNPKDRNDEVFEDIVHHGKNERYVYKELSGLNLSRDAELVLDKAKELVKSSFRYRKLFNMEHPQYHVNTWDAGWYQIKGILKEYNKDGLKEFNALYTELENRMRPLVYELGFLRL